MNSFIDNLQKYLETMSEEEKDAWIISQAKITPEWRQEDFYKSICGKKRVIDLPDRMKIDEFCEKVENGEIVVEYETHYVEFDDYGHFHDDWEHEFSDPSNAMNFLEEVLRGCHELVLLEEYEQALEIMDEIMVLEFSIENHPNTDDDCEDDLLNLHEAVTEGMLSIDYNQLLDDYLESCSKSVDDPREAAKKIISILEMQLFQRDEIEHYILLTPNEKLLTHIKEELQINLKTKQALCAENSRKDPYSLRVFVDQKNIRYIEKLIEYFDRIGEIKEEKKESFLAGTWKQISELIKELMNERYIDDQFQIEEIWEIVQALIKRGGFEKESWEVKEQILREIYRNDFFNYYGISDPMYDLVEVICSTKEESLKRAEIMMGTESGCFGVEAAKLYSELGEEEKCIAYFENHFGKTKEAYEIVMEHYRNRNHDKAVEIARLAIANCKEDQTPFFILLIQDAKDRGDKVVLKKLMQSAHMRKLVNSAEVDAMFS